MERIGGLESRDRQSNVAYGKLEIGNWKLEIEICIYRIQPSQRYIFRCKYDSIDLIYIEIKSLLEMQIFFFLETRNANLLGFDILV